MQRVSHLLGKVDEFYKLYDDITNRHIFDMPKLEGGKKADKAEFSNLILAKKLEKVILKDQLSKISFDDTNQYAFVHARAWAAAHGFDVKPCSGATLKEQAALSSGAALKDANSRLPDVLPKQWFCH